MTLPAVKWTGKLKPKFSVNQERKIVFIYLPSQIVSKAKIVARKRI
ncbi:hypothetical protein O53_5042 [Microcystis aeruginosa TAIHU98]|uniref:Uncharacterized protein n=2 Tax=Microcystis aeruginosa TaxID=1126 RepID=L7E1J2_MICAE|nr:hypothetical protein BH695_2111 [Microcystis aeruginosa PCC 7806SL]ELP52147.1 hypothetical protein O53_5042 [Microcystis aeruginosa TAIHU98]ELS48160.1 hypothetical protein C789_2083 [Microcystis aeruginosa FACHB-905 = DIANCHI905]